MEKRIEEVVHDIAKVCEEAKLNEDPKNLIHVLIAYLRTSKVKSEEDYAVNAIVAVLIHDTLLQLKEDSLTMAINEIAILCKAIMIYDGDSEEEDLDEDVIKHIKEIDEKLARSEPIKIEHLDDNNEVVEV